MKRSILLGSIVATTFLAVQTSALGAPTPPSSTSVPAAKADGGINLCIGCPASTSTSQGSVPICIDSARCARWFYYSGYLVWGPQTGFFGNYTIKRYFVYSHDGSVYYGFSDCLYLYGYHQGCYWTGQ